ncbi:hypothetical protein [Reyranella soli]|jgi:hypothetical protein|uniref:DUF3570 domain-containing protein n=1 Tax=Reyranella soli TaxID=1230389 RepID=A0A512NH21_9HYPH|nr:hypothetical protein [Reyranella soli]GEP58231.1 hypothetical protein RSO01_53970 [Reyranella soli]
MFGTPDRYGVTPQDNIFATTPGLEQQARRSAFTFNILAPISYNSNAAAGPSGVPTDKNSAEFSPVVGLSWSTPVFDLPLRFTANARAEVDRFTQVPSADFDKIVLSSRLQYVDPTNDQAYSPYIVYAPRWSYTPFYQDWLQTRQDLSVGVNKTFNFDANFRRVPFAADTLAETTWSFGVTTFFQRRFSNPGPSSWALFVIPSATYVFSEQWNLSLGVEFMRRAFESYQGGPADEDWLLQPIATLEFVLPSAWFGSDRNATLVGRPALDFQVAYERNWSTVPVFDYSALHVGVALKMGWRF